MLILLDNYDSFTYNLLHYVEQEDEQVKVFRNDEITPREAFNLNPTGIIISPGPCDPSKAGISMSLIKEAAGKVPVLGVCLGHQAIGEVFGGKVVRAPLPMHGKISAIKHDGSGIFKNIPSPFDATRYHSLIVEKISFPKDLKITASTDDNIIMGLSHVKYEIHGVQFHPESIASQFGHEIIRNFVKICRGA